MTPLAPSQPAPTKDQLLAMFKEPVQKIVQTEVAGDIEPEKLYQLRLAQKADLYWRALQYVIPKLSEAGIASFSSIGTPMGGDSLEKDGAGLYDYVQNIYRGYGRKFIAVLGQRAPNVAAVADDPEDEDSSHNARMADVAAQILRAKWDADLQNLVLALHLWKNGTTFAYTPYVTDGTKYGYSQEPQLQSRTVVTKPATDLDEAETMDVPEVVGQQRYANGQAELHLCNIMTVSVPFFTKSLEDAPHLTYEYEEYAGKLKAAYPKLREKQAGSTGSTETSASGVGAIVRDTASSPVGVPNPRRESRWNYKRIWLTPAMYEAEKDQQVRDALCKQYPDGLKVTIVEGDIVDLEAEKLTDVWAACKPETSEYIFADAIGLDLMPAQDLKNDALNLAYETFERGISVTFADPRVIDIQQWTQHQATPAEIIPALANVGENLGSAFFQVPPAKASDQLQPWQASVEEDARAVVGVLPPIFGGGADDPTARQAELKKNAALMQLGTTWTYMRKFWEKVFENGVRQLARYGAGTLRGVKKGTDGYKSVVVDIAQLKEDGWHFEAEEAIPMTWGQQRDLLMFMMEKPPQVLQAYGYTHPRNVERNQQLLGMTGYYMPGVDEHEKAREIIAELIKAKPIQQPGQNGQIQLQPSIPIDDFDDHMMMAQEAVAWLVGPGRRVREDNEDGFQNVIAWWQGHNQAANPPQAPPPAPPPRLSVSLPLDKVDPNTRSEVLGDFGMQIQPAPNPMPGPAPAPGPQPVPPPPAPSAQPPTQPPGPAAPPPGPPSTALGEGDPKPLPPLKQAA